MPDLSSNTQTIFASTISGFLQKKVFLKKCCLNWPIILEFACRFWRLYNKAEEKVILFLKWLLKITNQAIELYSYFISPFLHAIHCLYKYGKVSMSDTLEGRSDLFRYVSIMECRLQVGLIMLKDLARFMIDR